ncbi:MAG TPA: hypothetical protein VKR61_06865 [Bryobacteraceae bacterium]|nr:hypothetical protein [Bryobacteraceae bacterium]
MLTIVAALMVLAYIQIFVRHRTLDVAVQGDVETFATVDQVTNAEPFKIEVENGSEPVQVQVQR